MEATPEQSAEGLAIVRVLAAVLDRLVQTNAPIARADPGQITKFHAMKAPGIGIQQYLERIHKYASCSNECFILALIYIDRLIQRSNFLLTELNVHRVVITAVLLAAKFFDDAYYNNAYYAKVGGVLVPEMNGLEVDFLFRINFSLHVTPDVFDKYRAELSFHSINALLAVNSPALPSSTMVGFNNNCNSPLSSMVPLQQQQQHFHHNGKVFHPPPTSSQQQHHHHHHLQSQFGGDATDPLHITTEVLIDASQMVAQQAAVAAAAIVAAHEQQQRMHDQQAPMSSTHHGMRVTNADEVVCLGAGDPVFFSVPQVIAASATTSNNNANNNTNLNNWEHAAATVAATSNPAHTPRSLCAPKPMMAPPSLISSNKLGVQFFSGPSTSGDPLFRIYPIQSTLVHHHHHHGLTTTPTNSTVTNTISQPQQQQQQQHRLGHLDRQFNFSHPVLTGGMDLHHHHPAAAAASYCNAQLMLSRMPAEVSTTAGLV